MGYVKGSIDLSSTQDGLLLEQVLRSRHATHDQLWQFFQLKARENRRRIFNWRMLRLVQHGLITRLNVKYARRGWVYAISESGAAYLAGNGDGAALVASKAFKQLDDPVVLHSLDLNDVHLTLIRCGEFIRWKSELEILCLNELTGFGYAKDYDAVITIHSDGEESTFALEYERQPKAANRYWQVRQAIEKERQVRCFLYLTPSYELLSYVAGFFDRCAKAVYFGGLEDFRQHGLDAQVLDSRRTLSFPFRAMLNGNGA
jgi:hypothetical protein